MNHDEVNPIALKPLLSEQLLIDALPTILGDIPATRSVVISPGRAQLADRLLESGASTMATAWYLDLYVADKTSRFVSEAVDVVCSSDLPEEEFDFVGMPVLKRSESELTRDLLQQGHQRLREGGVLATSVDNGKDQWLHEQMQGMFDKVSCDRQKNGCVYWGRKTKPLKKVKDFSCQFAFRDEERLIEMYSRPGVFSHRRLDNGARQLTLVAEVGPSDTVLDMGCGAGAVALACAFRTTGTVYAIDSHARAVECTQRGAELNGLTNVRAILNAQGAPDLPEPVDLVLANPPYYGDDAISKHFVDTAIEVLRPAGALLVVTKQPRWYLDYFGDLLVDVLAFESSRYHVVCGRKI